MCGDQLLGHERARSFLARAAAEGTLAPAYLFTGPPRIGKKLVALTFARALLCREEGGVPCGTCSSCRKADLGVHPDLRLLEPQVNTGRSTARSIKIEHIREMQRAVSLKAHEGNRKIVLIDDAEFLTEQAGNALLKILEEPPDDTVFLLVSSSLNALLPTIVSRCQIVPFSPLPEDQVARIVAETQDLEADAARLLAALSRGRVGQALELSAAPREEYLALAFSLLTRRPEEGFAQAHSRLQNLGKERRDLEAFLEFFLLLSRDLLVLKSGAGEEFVVNRDQVAEMNRARSRLSPAALGRIAAMIAEALGQLRGNANPELTLDALAVRISRARSGVKDFHHV